MAKPLPLGAEDRIKGKQFACKSFKTGKAGSLGQDALLTRFTPQFGEGDVYERVLKKGDPVMGKLAFFSSNLGGREVSLDVRKSAAIAQTQKKDDTQARLLEAKLKAADTLMRLPSELVHQPPKPTPPLYDLTREQAPSEDVQRLVFKQRVDTLNPTKLGDRHRPINTGSLATTTQDYGAGRYNAGGKGRAAAKMAELQWKIPTLAHTVDKSLRFSR